MIAVRFEQPHIHRTKPVNQHLPFRSAASNHLNSIRPGVQQGSKSMDSSDRSANPPPSSAGQSIRLPSISSLLTDNDNAGSLSAMQHGRSSALNSSTKFSHVSSPGSAHQLPRLIADGQRSADSLPPPSASRASYPASSPSNRPKENDQREGIYNEGSREALPSLRGLALYADRNNASQSAPASPPRLPGLDAVSGRARAVTDGNTSSGLLQARQECEQLLDIFYHLRRENRMRGLHAGHGDAVPHSDAIRHGDTRLVMDFIEAELAAVAAKEGVRVAESVAESYGFRPDRSMAFVSNASPTTSHQREYTGLPHPTQDRVDSRERTLSGSSSVSTHENRLPSLAQLSQSHHPNLGPEHWQEASRVQANNSRHHPSSSAESIYTDRSPNHYSAYASRTSPTAEASGLHQSLEDEGSRMSSVALQTAGLSAGSTSATGRRSKARRRVMKREGETPACLGCGRLATAEWRRGPTGPRTLCNACGLLFAKMTRMRRAEASNGEEISDPTLEQLRVAVEASSKGQGRAGTPLAVVGGNHHARSTGDRPHHHHHHPHHHHRHHNTTHDGPRSRPEMVPASASARALVTSADSGYRGHHHHNQVSPGHGHAEIGRHYDHHPSANAHASSQPPLSPQRHSHARHSPHHPYYRPSTGDSAATTPNAESGNFRQYPTF